MTHSLQHTVWLRAVADEARVDLAIVVIVFTLFGSLIALVPSLVSEIIKHRIIGTGAALREIDQ